MVKILLENGSLEVLATTALQELKVCRTDTYVIYPKHSKFMSIIIKDLSYTHTDKEVLFSNLNLIINSGEKTALTGNNGCGKSTLMPNCTPCHSER